MESWLVHAWQALLFLSTPPPHTHTHCYREDLPAGIHSRPSDCDILYLLLRSIRPAGKPVPLSGHHKPTAAWSPQRTAKPWQSGGGAANECFQSGMFRCRARDWHIREVVNTINITKCVRIHMYMIMCDKGNHHPTILQNCGAPWFLLLWYPVSHFAS